MSNEIYNELDELLAPPPAGQLPALRARSRLSALSRPGLDCLCAARYACPALAREVSTRGHVLYVNRRVPPPSHTRLI